MELNMVIQGGDKKEAGIQPQKFALWVAFAGIIMMFAAWTSAYIVRKSQGNWQEFPLPNLFFVSTGVILLSSLTLQIAYSSFKNGRESLYKGLLVATLVLGCAFLALQYQGWVAMDTMGVRFDGNPSGSFVYVISMAHAAHILGGIGVLVMALIHAFALDFRVTQRRIERFQLTCQYWHFVDILWLYLLGFFLLN